MSSKVNRIVAIPARVETLESRRLLSTSPASHVADALVETAAVHTHGTLPQIAGNTYAATLTVAGHSVSFATAFTSESTTGALQATVTSSVTPAFACTGTVKTNSAVALHGKEGKLTLAISAKVSSDLSKLSGRVTVHGKKSITVGFTATLEA